MLFPGLSYPPNTAAHPIGVVQLHALQLCNDYSSSNEGVDLFSWN